MHHRRYGFAASAAAEKRGCAGGGCQAIRRLCDGHHTKPERGVLTAEDQEEIASDVFVSLWRGAKSISRGQLRPWLGAVARNQTADAMRRKRVYVPLEDDTLISLEPLWERMYESQRCEAIRSALLALSDEDREIFYRFYDLAQTAAQIAEAMQMNASTVRSRLMRGRETLRKELTEGGLLCEDELG